MTSLSEELLNAWLQLSKTIINNKIVSDMPYNESLICNILYRSQLQTPEKRLTATDLCNETQMLKSQMNRTLNQMEEKGIILRERSDRDKRQVFITLDMENAASYRQQHEKILRITDAVIEQTGKEKAMEIIDLFNAIANIAEGILK